MIGGYRFLPVATARCVHFVDLCPDDVELRELAGDLDEHDIAVVYLDCTRFVPGTGARKPAAPTGDAAEPHWTRWWDDLLSLSHKSSGLVIVLDHADVLFERDRKFATDLIENFLQGATPWIRREIPCHLVLQMAACAAVARVFERKDEAGDDKDQR